MSYNDFIAPLADTSEASPFLTGSRVLAFPHFDWAPTVEQINTLNSTKENQSNSNFQEEFLSQRFPFDKMTLSLTVTDDATQRVEFFLTVFSHEGLFNSAAVMFAPHDVPTIFCVTIKPTTKEEQQEHPGSLLKVCYEFDGKYRWWKRKQREWVATPFGVVQASKQGDTVNEYLFGLGKKAVLGMQAFGAALRSPKNLTVEVVDPEQVRKGEKFERKHGIAPRHHQRARLILLTAEELVRRQYPQLSEAEAKGRASHYRRGHWRTYRSGRYSAELRATPKWIKSCRVDPTGAMLKDSWIEDKQHYKILWDLGAPPELAEVRNFAVPKQ